MQLKGKGSKKAAGAEAEVGSRTTRKKDTAFRTDVSMEGGGEFSRQNTVSDERAAGHPRWPDAVPSAREAAGGGFCDRRKKGQSSISSLSCLEEAEGGTEKLKIQLLIVCVKKIGKKRSKLRRGGEIHKERGAQAQGAYSFFHWQPIRG